jgi:drug/metabolite transporter (DMT)-like permease
MDLFSNYKSNLFLNLILVYIIWGSTYMGVKIALTDLPPLFLTGIRFFIGGSFLLAFTLMIKGFPKLSEVKGSILLGTLLTGAGTTSLAYAIQFLDTGFVALLAALLPIWIFLLDFFLFSKSKPTTLSGVGMIIGLGGVLFLFNPFGMDGIDASKLFPILMVFFSSLIWAFASLLSLKTTQVQGIQGVSIQMVSGGAVAFIASFFLENNQIESVSNMGSSSIFAMLYLILIGSYIGYSAFVWLINNAPPVLTSTYAFVNPVVAIIIGYFIANEILDSSSISASALILTGVVFMTLGRKKKGDF